MNLYLSEISASQLHFLKEIYSSSFKEILEKYQDYDSSPATQSLTVLAEVLNRKDNSVYFIMKDSLIIGSIRVVIQGSEGKIGPIAILPEFQRRGYGSQAFLLVEKKHFQIKKWMLDTIKEESHLVKMYESLGFEHISTKPQNEYGMTLIWLEKEV